MSEEPHAHKFNATIITTRQTPVLRCVCGVWATKKNIEAAKANGGEVKLCAPRTMKGLETRLKNERKVARRSAKLGGDEPRIETLWGSVFEETGELTFWRHLVRRSREEFYSHVRPTVKALAEREQRITWAEYQGMRGNRYEHKLLRANLDDDALIRLFEQMLAQCSQELGPHEIARDYNTAIMQEIAPLLAKRLRAAIMRP